MIFRGKNAQILSDSKKIKGHRWDFSLRATSSSRPRSMCPDLKSPTLWRADRSQQLAALKVFCSFVDIFSNKQNWARPGKGLQSKKDLENAVC
jgi:hypothetical protein